jgi:hypothetical protein
MPHAVTLIRSATLSGVAEYAYAATAPAGSRLIFLAGACPLNEDGSTATVGDYRKPGREISLPLKGTTEVSVRV